MGQWEAFIGGALAAVLLLGGLGWIMCCEKTANESNDSSQLRMFLLLNILFLIYIGLH